MNQIKFAESADEKLAVLQILFSTFNHEQYAKNLSDGIWINDGGCEAKTLIYLANGEVVSVIVYGTRHIRYESVYLKAYTVGPVATKPNQQGKGYSKKLINQLIDISKNDGIDLIYIQGIDTYYTQFGFYPYTAKSKFSTDVKSLRSKSTECIISDVGSDDLNLIADFYSRQNENINGSSKRSVELWDWLIEKGRNTYYFYNPKKITTSNGELICYFTGDPINHENIREIIFSQQVFHIDQALAVIKEFYLKNGYSQINFNCSKNSYFLNYAKQYLNGEFVQYIRSQGSSLMKIINLDQIFNKIKFELTEKIISNVFCSTVNIRIRFEADCDLCIEHGDIFVADVDSSSPDIYIPKEYIPGLLFGYYSEQDIKHIFPELSHFKQSLISDFFSTNQTFIYQADNY